MSEFKRISPEEMLKVKFDMQAPWGLVDRYTVGVAIADAQLVQDKADRDKERRALGEWLEEHTTIWEQFGLDGSDLMVFSLSPQYANNAIQALKRGELPEGMVK
jgi:hypothetical protein